MSSWLPMEIFRKIGNFIKKIGKTTINFEYCEILLARYRIRLMANSVISRSSYRYGRIVHITRIDVWARCPCLSVSIGVLWFILLRVQTIIFNLPGILHLPVVVSLDCARASHTYLHQEF